MKAEDWTAGLVDLPASPVHPHTRFVWVALQAAAVADLARADPTLTADLAAALGALHDEWDPGCRSRLGLAAARHALTGAAALGVGAPALLGKVDARRHALWPDDYLEA